MSEKKPTTEPAAATEKAAAVDTLNPGSVERPFVRVIDVRTGHEFDVHRQALDPENHRLVKDADDSWTARPANPNPNPGPVRA